MASRIGCLFVWYLLLSSSISRSISASRLAIRCCSSSYERNFSCRRWLFIYIQVLFCMMPKVALRRQIVCYKITCVMLHFRRSTIQLSVFNDLRACVLLTKSKSRSAKTFWNLDMLLWGCSCTGWEIWLSCSCKWLWNLWDSVGLRNSNLLSFSGLCSAIICPLP